MVIIIIIIKNIFNVVSIIIQNIFILNNTIVIIFI